MSNGDSIQSSIIITAYNYERYVQECIASCVAQEPPHGGYEILLVDDGSTDHTLEIARRAEPAIRVIAKANGGVEQAANAGLREAKGEFVVRVDADDRLNPAFLRTMVPALAESDFGAAFAYAEYETIDAESQRLEHVALPDFDVAEIRERGDFLATGTLYRKAALTQVGLYNEGVTNCGLENYELILRLLAADQHGRCVHANLFGYRRHGANMTATRKESIIAYGMQLAREFGLDGYRTNQFHPAGLVL
jgi:glycosyltransferase involved in cell wall biosynthesis